MICRSLFSDLIPLPTSTHPLVNLSIILHRLVSIICWSSTTTKKPEKKTKNEKLRAENGARDTVYYNAQRLWSGRVCITIGGRGEGGGVNGLVAW